MQVAEQGLTPGIVIRACNNPRITNSIPSCKISKVVAKHAEAKISRRWTKRKGRGTTKDTAGGE